MYHPPKEMSIGQLFSDSRLSLKSKRLYQKRHEFRHLKTPKEVANALNLFAHSGGEYCIHYTTYDTSQIIVHGCMFSSRFKQDVIEAFGDHFH